MTIALSNTQLKAIDRAGGAYLALPWPAGLARPSIDEGDERPATSAGHLAALRATTAVAAANGLVHVATLMAQLHPPGDWGLPGQPVLLAHVVTPRWQRVTRPGAQGRALWVRELWP